MWPKIIILVLLSLAIHCGLLGQTTGDFRSAVTTGNWNVNSSWQRFNGSVWVAAPLPPTQMDGVITIQTGHTISIAASSEIVDQVVVEGTLRVSSGQVVSFPVSPLSDVILVNGILDITGTLDMNTNSVVRINGTLISRQGALINNATASNLFFQTGSFYQHNYTSSAGSIPLATWAITSTCRFAGSSSYTTAPSNLNQTFGNVTFDMTGGSSVDLNGGLTTVKGSLTITSINNRAIRLGGSSNYTLSIDGDFVKDGTGLLTINTISSINNTVNVLGSFSHNNGSIILSNGSLVFNVAMNYTWINGSFTRGGSGTASIVFNGNTIQNFQNTTSISYTNGFSISVNSGSTLDIGAFSSIAGAGSTFTLNSGATLRLGSTNSTGALVIGNVGNIRVTGTRTYNSGSTIIYNGTGAQSLGTGHPSTAGITTVINNTAGVALAPTSYILNGDLVLTAGNLDISGKSLTLGGIFTPNGNSLQTNAFTNLTIDDTGTISSFGLLKISNSNVLGTLTLGGTIGRIVQLGANLTIADNLALSAGDLQLNGYTLTLQSGLTVGTGVLTSSASSGLSITDEGFGILPADLQINGGSINTLSVKRDGATIGTSSNLIISNLNLFAGTFTHTGIINMSTTGKITIERGVLTNPVGAITTYDVDYIGNDDIFTGNELPINAVTLNNLTNLKPNPYVLSLSANTTINGSLILSDGTFNSNLHDITFNGNIVSNALSDFSSGTATFNGNSLISGTIAPQFGNILVSSSKTLAIDQNLQINVAGNFNVDGTFNPNQSTVEFNGSNNQVIDGTTPILFYKLNIDKSAGDVTVQHTTSIQDALNILTITNLNAGNELLTLNSTSARTARVNPLITGANIFGSVIVQRHLPNGAGNRAYRYITPQVTSSTVADWKNEVPITGTFSDPSTGAGINSSTPSLFYYDETYTTGGTTLESRYRNYPASGAAAAASLTNGIGYALFVRSTSSITMDSRGTLAQHQRIINVTAQSAGGNDGWNLIGNPYPSPVLWDKVTKSVSVGNALYLADNTNITGEGAGTFISYVNGVSVPSNVGYKGIIDSGQGFWVHATADGQLTFDETDKIIDSDSIGQFYRTGEINDLLRISIAGISGNDEAAIRIHPEATDEFDNQFDALKFSQSSVNLFTKTSSDKMLAINSLASLSCEKIIPVSMNNLKIGSHTISITGFESFESDVDFFLIDNETSKTIDLRKTSTFVIEINDSNILTFNNRFTLQIRKSRLLRNLPVSSQAICANENLSTVVVSQSQPELEYQALLNNIPVTSWYFGNSQDLVFNIPAKNLEIGTHQFTLLVRNACHVDTLISKAIVDKMSIPEKPVVNNIVTCEIGPVTVEASGARLGDNYLWYKLSTDQTAFFKSANSKLLLNDFDQSTSYFVSIANSNGCESEKVEVTVSLISLEEVTITRAENTLISSSELGNQWYLNDNPIVGETSQHLSITTSGVYKVVVTRSSCSVEAISTEIFSETGFSIYPNPIVNNTTISFDRDNATADISIMSISGVEVFKDTLVTTSRNQKYLIKTEELPAGIYFMKVWYKGKVFTERIVKI
jgi:hypothetical protein